MMLRGRRLWFWIGLLLVVAATAGIAAFVFYSRNQDSTIALVSTLVALLTAAAGTGAWLWTRVQPPPDARLSLERAADELAEQLRRQWERVTAERGLAYPAPIPLQWRWSPRPVTGPRAEAVRDRFVPLPGMAAVTVEDLQSGALKDLLRVYGGLGSGRLVVLGEPGAGKSGSGIRLLLDSLAHRATLTAEDQARVPVPVLVTPHGWDPAAESFAEWLADRLARDYALLRAPEYGEDAAMRLIQSGHLAVILDGLDEMPEALRSMALRALDDQVTFRLVVLTRSAELEAAVSDAHLRGAAALELLPIGPEQAADYLASGQIDPLPAPWQHLIDHLREHPDGVLAQALTTPLTLTLIRDTYGPGEKVDELIDVERHRFGSAQAIEDHLLDRVLTTAYTRRPGQPAPPYTVDQAQRWFGQLARRMNEEGTRNLDWWQIPYWVPAWPRVFVTVIVISLSSALLVGSLAGVAVNIDLFSAAGLGPLAAFVTVFGKTLGYAFMFGPGLLLGSLSGEGSPQQRDRLRWSRTDILMILLLGLGVGVGFGLETGLLLGLERGLAIGIVTSFVVAFGYVLGGGPPQQLGRLRWSRTDPRTNLLTGLVSGLAVGLVYGLTMGLLYGIEYTFAASFLVGIGYMLVIVIGGLSPLQRSRLRWSRTDTPITLLIGLVIATVSTVGYGIVYILIVILARRPSLPRSRLRWSKTHTSKTLFTGLMGGLILGFLNGIVDGIHGLDEFLFPLVLGLLFGLAGGLLLGLRQPPTQATSPLDPQSLWRRERQFGLGLGFAGGLTVGLVYGLVNGLAFGLTVGFVFGLTDGFAVGLGLGLASSATWATALASAQLWRRNEAPVRLLRFLDDARERQVLRTVGPTYQFRHARLQDRLAETSGAVPGKVSDTHVDQPSLSS